MFASTTVVHAGLYKGLDADGNVAYSDEPFNDAKEMTPPTITVLDPVKVTPKKNHYRKASGQKVSL